MNELKAVKVLQDWIVESEMNGLLETDDPFYPAYERLQEIKEKLEESE